MIEDSVRDMIEEIGDDPEREGLIETPRRVAKAYQELFAGYEQDPEEILAKVFQDGACEELVILKNIELSSMCEHHCLPFSGHISIGYIPNGVVVGISKLARLVEVFARRLQIQEKLTSQIADTLVKALNPHGVMVVCEAQHLCMTARGVKKQNSVMVTSAVRGIFKDDPRARAEFLSLIK